jgi:hypothetical protein
MLEWIPKKCAVLKLTHEECFSLHYLACNVKWLGLRGHDLPMLPDQSFVPLKSKDLQIAQSLMSSRIIQVNHSEPLNAALTIFILQAWSVIFAHHFSSFANSPVTISRVFDPSRRPKISLRLRSSGSAMGLILKLGHPFLFFFNFFIFFIRGWTSSHMYDSGNQTHVLFLVTLPTSQHHFDFAHHFQSHTYIRLLWCYTLFYMSYAFLD